MKEITRIHLAKVAYDAEVEAKKELESYLKSLSTYSQDQDLLEDIEIRMTELLTLRGVEKNGVIGITDVQAIKEQLGEPYEFMADGGDIAVGDIAATEATKRKLYRDMDGAVVGGVFSGLAAFFNTNVIWIRIIAVILLLASFGTISLIYIVLWLAVPAAETVSQRLEMKGLPVTLATIHELGDTDDVRQRAIDRSTKIKRGITILLGLASVAAALGALLLTVVAAISFSGANYEGEMAASTGLVAAYWLAVLSGVLLALLFLIVSYICFAQKLSKRLIVGAVVVTIAGLVSFSGAIAGIGISDSQINRAYEQNIKETNRSLPESFNGIKSVTFDIEGVQVVYKVDAKARYELRSASDKKPKIDIQGSTAKVSLAEQESVYSYRGLTILTIYGPALENVAIIGGDVDYQAANQPQLALTIEDGATASIGKGRVETIVASVAESARLTTEMATIGKVTLTMSPQSTVRLGAIEVLSLTTSESCPVDSETEVSVWRLADATFTLNGKDHQAISFDQNCLEVRFDEQNDDN